LLVRLTPGDHSLAGGKKVRCVPARDPGVDVGSRILPSGAASGAKGVITIPARTGNPNSRLPATRGSFISFFLLLCSFCVWWTARSTAQNARLTVVLDSASFAGISFSMMQETANRVAESIEHLIPGSLPAGQANVFCFAVVPEWGPAPITLFGEPQPGEPAASALYATRVAISRSVLPDDRQRFAFQLAHELAHVIMDPRFDNEMVETFAVAVSLEVLERLGYVAYLQAAVESLIAPLPAAVKAALKRGSWSDVTLYLASQRQYHQANPFDYSLAAAGAQLIRSLHLLPWNRLLGVAARSTCPGGRDAARFHFCPLNESTLPEFSAIWRRLGRTAVYEATEKRQ